MFNEFDDFISGFFTEDYWYDEGVFEAQDLIQEFGEEDYIELQKVLLSKSDEWKMRFVYCIDSDLFNKDLLSGVVSLLDTDNDDLFEMCIDSLNAAIDERNIDVLLSSDNYSIIIDKLRNTSQYMKPTVESFMKKVNDLN